MSLTVRGALASLGKGVWEGQFRQREMWKTGDIPGRREREKEVGPTMVVRCLASVGGRDASGLRSSLRACSAQCMIYFPLVFIMLS